MNLKIIIIDIKLLTWTNVNPTPPLWSKSTEEGEARVITGLCRLFSICPSDNPSIDKGAPLVLLFPVINEGKDTELGGNNCTLMARSFEFGIPLVSSMTSKLKQLPTTTSPSRTGKPPSDITSLKRKNILNSRACDRTNPNPWSRTPHTIPVSLPSFRKFFSFTARANRIFSGR